MYSQWSHTSWLRGGCLPITVRPANWRSMRLRYWSLGTKKNSCSKPMNACTPLTPCRVCMKEYVHCSEIGCADEDTESSNGQFISVVKLSLWGIFLLWSGWLEFKFQFLLFEEKHPYWHSQTAIKMSFPGGRLSILTFIPRSLQSLAPSLLIASDALNRGVFSSRAWP